MTPELEYLMARCGYPSQVEEYLNDILSMSSSELTGRLLRAIKSVQENSTFFGRIERDKWYVVMPPTSTDAPRCLLGKVFLDASVIFPDPESPKASASKKEREEFEKLYVRTFMERTQLVHNYSFALDRVHELGEVSEDILLHAQDLAHLNIWHAKRDYKASKSKKKKDEIARQIGSMNSCLSALAAERRRRFEEKGSL